MTSWSDGASQRGAGASIPWAGEWRHPSGSQPPPRALPTARSARFRHVCRRFPHPPAHRISSTTTGNIPIVNRSFSLSGNPTIKGKFNGAMTKVSGTLACRDHAVPSCSLSATSWSASRR
jgi:hypothetical protein